MAQKWSKQKWLEFKIKAWNIILGLTLDGVNPFGDLSSCHFTWSIILLNYNLPPWLVVGFNHFCKESITVTNVDVYLELLIEELLQMLWQGVKKIDSL